MSDGHAEGDGHPAVGHVALIVGPGDRFLSGVSYYTALHRSSASGPMSIAMNWGLPLVTTSVGGLVEATAGYTGAVLVPPGDPAALADGIRTALPLVGAMHADPQSWRRNAERYAALLDRIDAGWSRDGPIPAEQTVKSSVAGEVE